MHADLVDAIQPPALMLEWNDPWLELAAVAGGYGLYYARLNVLCFAGRVEPGPGVAKLEELVTYTLTRLQADAYSWPLDDSQAPRVMDVNNIPLLFARLLFRVPVALEGGTP